MGFAVLVGTEKAAIGRDDHRVVGGRLRKANDAFVECIPALHCSMIIPKSASNPRGVAGIALRVAAAVT